MRVSWIFIVFTGSLSSSGTLAQDALADARSESTSSTIAPDSVTRDFIADARSMLKSVRRQIYPYISDLAADENLSQECIGSLFALARGIQEEEGWALMMLTSFGFLPQNVFLGSQAAAGSYDQCLASEKKDYEGRVSIRGQYCTLFLPPNKKLFEHAKGIVGNNPFYKIFYEKGDVPEAYLGIPMAFRFGLCTPHKCVQEELNYVLDKMVNKVYGFNGTITLCRTSLTTRSPNRFQSFVMILCTVLFVLLIVGSVADYLFNRGRKTPQYISSSLALTVAMMFSPQRNTRRLFAPYSAESKPLAFLNGIKVLFAAWVVYGHCVLFVGPDLIYNVAGMLSLLSSVPFQIVANSFLSVTGFFFLSGFILGYMCLKESERIRKNNAAILVLIMFVRRYYRLIIPYLAVVSVTMLFPLWIYSSSDSLSAFASYGKSCSYNWWTTPAMMSNYLKFEELCLAQSWYLSVDLQLFIVAAILVMSLIHKPAMTLWLIYGLIAASCVWIGVTTYEGGFNAVVSYSGQHPDEILRAVDTIYLNPITHLGSYLVGIICAYVTLNRPTHLRWRVRVIMWLVALTCTTYVTFITVLWYRKGFPSRAAQTLFAAVHRPIFCLGLFWLIFACVNNMAPNIRSILGHPILGPLGRLTFGIYLVHPGVIAIRLGKLMGQSIFGDQFLLILSTLGCFCISVGAAFLLNIAVESPLTHLDTYIFASLTAKLMGGQDKKNLADPPETILTPVENEEHTSKTMSGIPFGDNQHLKSVITSGPGLPKYLEASDSCKIRL